MGGLTLAVRDKGAVQHLDSASHGRDKGAVEASVAGGASYTATTALTSQPSTLSASGTFTTPEYTAAASLASPASTLAAAGTFVGPTYTGSAALTSQASTLSASGTHTPPGEVSATASLASAASTLSASGTFEAPTYTGSAALTTPASTLSASGIFATEVYSASANLQTAATSITAMGAFEAPEYTATVSLTTPASTFSGSGTFTAAVANLAVSIDGTSVDSGGTYTLAGLEAGAATALTIVLTNDGDAPLTVSSYAVSGEANCTVGLDSGPVTPFELDPDETAAIIYNVTPTANGAVSFTVTIASDDPDGDFVFEVSGLVGALVPDDSRIWQAAVRQTIWRAPKRLTVWRA